MESTTLNEEELLSDEFEKVLEEYNYCDFKENREAMLHFLQHNNCREVIPIAKCINGDKLAFSFCFASANNHSDILQAFLDQGMNIDIKNKFGNTALILASDFGDRKVVELLLQKNADVNIQSNLGVSALMSAATLGNKEVVQLLLNYNADVDLKNEDGQTALDLAKTEEIKEMIRNHVSASYVLK